MKFASVSFVIVTIGFLGACSSNPVGRVCFLGTDAAPSTSVVSSPALDCQSRICLHFASQQVGEEDLCTGECESDGDCEQDPASPCENGFTCGVPVVVGPFCCKKMCICRDYLPSGERDGGLEFPAVCDQGNPDNSCCNLPNRRGNPDMYPNCVDTPMPTIDAGGGGTIDAGGGTIDAGAEIDAA